jgi:ribosomal-protein-alanine N-acetyltransferase
VQGAPEATLPDGFSIEPMVIERDLDGVMAVEEASFNNHTSRDSFEWEARNSDVARFHVLRDPAGTVLAFCASWLIFDELHINSLAVLPEWRRQHLGAALLVGVIEASRTEGARRATLEVRASNEPARRLYERWGFQQVAVRRGYYTNPVEDALILWAELATTGPPAG